ncbi:MAG TPA: hypothetical protein VNG53_04540 [Bacteroidia bacterium]|nr:hypothetical protein [Bacteroidia bacterium]
MEQEQKENRKNTTDLSKMDEAQATIEKASLMPAQLQQKENRKNALLMVGGIVLLLLFIYAVAKSGKATNTMSLPDVLPLIEGL